MSVVGVNSILIIYFIYIPWHVISTCERFQKQVSAIPFTVDITFIFYFVALLNEEYSPKCFEKPRRRSTEKECK